LRVLTENKDETESNSNILFDLSGRFDDLGEDLMKLSSQEHICTIYRKDEDKIDSIMEFLKTGIVKNERSVIIVDKKSKEDILNKMKSIEDIKNLLNTSAIVFVDSEDIYGSKSDFNLAKTVESIESYLEVPQEDNFTRVRLIIEILPFKNKDTTLNMSMEFHSSINILLSNRNINFFCLYNEYKFESKTLLEVIFSHSKLIFNGFLCENSFSIDPHQLQLTSEDRLDGTLYKKTVYEIVQREIDKQKRVKTDSYIQKETLKGINDSVFILDFKGKILEVNEAAYKTRGYTEEEMLSLNILDIMSSENKDLFDSRIEELKEKREITFETTHYCKNGSILDVEFKTKIISYVDQEFILSVGRDITERKNAEKVAKTSEEKYRSIFNNANNAIFLLKECEDGRFNKIVEANEQAVKMYGYSKEELFKMSPNDLNATGYEETEETLNKFLKERRIRFERTHKTKNGKVINVEVSSQLFELDGETVSHAMVQDITEKKKLEKERESAKKQLQLMKHSLDSSLSGIAVSDMNDKIIYVNNSYLQLWGYENSEELLGKGVEQILPYTHTSIEVAQEAMSELIKSGRWVGDIQSEKQDGSPIWVRMNLNLVYDPNDKPIAKMASFLDISNEKLIAKSLLESEEKYRGFVQNFKGIAFKGTLDFKPIFLHGAVEEITGYTEEEFASGSISWDKILHPDEIGKYMNPAEKLADVPNLTIERDYRIIHKNGEIRWVHELVSNIGDEKGKPVYAQGSIYDLSERKASEERIKESEKKFHTLYNEMKQAYALYKVIYDNKGNPQDGIVVELNPEYEKLTNRKKEDTIGKKISEAYPEGQHQDVNTIKVLGETVITGEIITLEYYIEDIGKWIFAKSFSPMKDHVAVLFEDITEKRKIENDLIANELKFRSIFNHSNDGYILRTVEGIVLEANPRFLELFGYESSEVISKKIRLLNTYETEEEHRRRKKEIDEKGYAQFETFATRKDGSLFPMEVNAVKLLLGDEEVVFVIFRDITERKKAEEILRRLNEELEEKVIQRTYQMETLYNIIKEISETFDLNEAMRIITKYISKLVDYDIIVQLITQEELNHIRIEAPKGNKGVIDDFIENVKEEFAELNPTASNNRDTTTIITSNKKPIQNISSHLSIPLIAEDKVVGFIVIGSEQEDAYIEEEIWFLYKIADNISHTLQRLKVIITAKKELETVLDHTSDSAILINSADSVVMANKAGNIFLELINYSETVGIDNEILDLEELKRIDKKELSLKGKTYYVSMNPIKTDFVHGWLLIIHDITEERELQKKILHQERLATLGKITGGIAHDFNNILASIIGAADFSLMSAENIESKEFLNLIIRQSERGASLIRQMLDFTRQAVIKPKPISLLDFIPEFSRVIRSSLPENISLSVNTKDWAVFMDQVQLQQLLLNLMFNSRDALIEGGKITITIEEIEHSKIIDFEEIEIDKNQDYIHFVIEDNGEGMNEQTKKMIFEPFFTTKDPGKGSGLGLSQVYGIVRQSNGYIHVESEMEVGTKVHFYIPKYEGLVEEEIVDSARLGEGRILLVEDDEDVREITKIMLENYGYVVVTAENGKIALDLYNDSFDLVLTDIIMPVMGGEKLIEKLLEIDPQIKCLAMTGYSDANVPEGVKVLNKPITSSKLVNYIQNELGQENGQAKIVQYKKREDGG